MPDRDGDEDSGYYIPIPSVGEQCHDGGSADPCTSVRLDRSHWLQSSVIIFGVVFGTGVLDIPRAFANLGWCLGTLALALFAFFARYSGGLLYRVKNDFFPETMSYAQAAEATVGRGFSRLVACLVMANWFLMLPYYLVGAATAMEAAFADTGAALETVTLHQWLLVLAIPLAFLLQNGTLHSISWIASVSNMSMLATCVIATVSLLSGSRAEPRTTHFWPPHEYDFLTSYSYMSSLIFAYQGHDMYYEIMREMETVSEFPRALGTANNLMLGTYLVISMVTYASRGDATPSFLLDAIPHSSMRTAASLLVVFHILVTYLLVNQPLAEKIHRRAAAGILRGSAPAAITQRDRLVNRLIWFGVTMGILASSVAIAALIPFFAVFQNLLGAALGAPIVFGGPALMYLRCCHIRNRKIGITDRIMTALFLGVLFPVCTGLGTCAALRDLVASWGGQTS